MCLYTTCTPGAHRSQRTADLDMTTQSCELPHAGDGDGTQVLLKGSQGSSLPSHFSPLGHFEIHLLQPRLGLNLLCLGRWSSRYPWQQAAGLQERTTSTPSLCGAGDWTQGSAHFTNRASSPVPLKKFIGNLESNLANLKLLYFQYFWNVLYSVVMNSSFCHLGRKIPLLKIRTSETWLKETPP